MFKAIALSITTLLCLNGAARAEFPTFIEKTVSRNNGVVLFTLSQYQSERGCTATPAGPIDTEPKPRLGRVGSRSITTKRDGPCGVKEYTTQRIFFRAGPDAGVDEFVLYVYPTAFWGGSAWRIRVKVTVR